MGSSYITMSNTVVLEYGFMIDFSILKFFIFSIVVPLLYNLKIECKKVILKSEIHSQMVTIQFISAFLGLKWRHQL